MDHDGRAEGGSDARVRASSGGHVELRGVNIASAALSSIAQAYVSCCNL